MSAYYHDIGKVDQADYFVENQKAHNRHDEMRPSLSVAVIKSHVRIGIEKARELNLPQAIIDIIAQHHGRGLITFFYHRAVKEGRNPRLFARRLHVPGGAAEVQGGRGAHARGQHRGCIARAEEADGEHAGAVRPRHDHGKIHLGGPG